MNVSRISSPEDFSENDEYSLLEVVLDSRQLKISYLSSVLRALQSVLREVARVGPETGGLFAQRPQPVLSASAEMRGSQLSFRLGFVSHSDSEPLREFSRQVGIEFIGRFTRFLSYHSQPTLFGYATPDMSPRRHQDPLERRMQRLSSEMHHLGGVAISLDDSKITFANGQFEIKG